MPVAEENYVFRTLLVLIAFTCLFLILQFYWNRRKLHKYASKFTILPKPIPILGHAYLFTGDTEGKY